MADSASHPPRSRGHEVADVDGRRVAWMAAGLVVALVVVALVAFAAHRLLRPDRANDRTQTPAQTIAASVPRLQTAPTLDLQALRDQKRAMLDRYRWLDQDKGIVQIPIEQAMQVVVERSATKRSDMQTLTRKKPEASP